MIEKNSVARIGKVTFKAGSNVVCIPALQHDTNRAQFLQHARTIASWHGAGKIAGWSIVVWNTDGAVSESSKNEDFSPITVTAMPSFVADVIRKRLIEDGAWK